MRRLHCYLKFVEQFKAFGEDKSKGWTSAFTTQKAPHHNLAWPDAGKRGICFVSHRSVRFGVWSHCRWAYRNKYIQPNFAEIANYLTLNPYLCFTSPLPGVKIRAKGRIFLFSVCFCPYLCTCHSDGFGCDSAKGESVIHDGCRAEHSGYTKERNGTVKVR